MSYSNYDVAHMWMTGQKYHATGHNLFFEGDTIYSYGYHFVIAMKWKGFILWNDNTYSNSTSKHQSYVRSAAYGEIVDCPYLVHCINPESKLFFDKNMEYFRNRIEEIAEGKLAKARKPEIYLNQIMGIARKAQRLCEVIGKKLPNEFEKYLNGTDKEELVERMREDAKKRLEAAERKRKRAEKERIKKFLNFERSYAETKYQICRLNTDSNRFETSLGVEIPFEVGRRFYEALKNGEVKVGDKLLYYIVREVGKYVKIGCHTFEKKYLMDYGKKVFNN